MVMVNTTMAAIREWCGDGEYNKTHMFSNLLLVTHVRRSPLAVNFKRFLVSSKRKEVKDEKRKRCCASIMASIFCALFRPPIFWMGKITKMLKINLDSSN